MKTPGLPFSRRPVNREERRAGKALETFVNNVVGAASFSIDTDDGGQIIGLVPELEHYERAVHVFTQANKAAWHVLLGPSPPTTLFLTFAAPVGVVSFAFFDRGEDRLHLETIARTGRIALVLDAGADRAKPVYRTARVPCDVLFDYLKSVPAA